jgi:hypothetical protein
MRFDNALAAQELAADIANMERDDRGGGGGGGGGGEPGEGPSGSGGLSPSQREEWGDAKDKVSAAQRAVQKGLDANMSLQEARRAAQNETDLDDWAFTIAMSLMRHNRLSRSAKALWRSHVPGGQIPQGWV